MATGDVNGDGFDDVVIASLVADGPGGMRDTCGEVVLIPGGAVRLTDLDLASPRDDVVFFYGSSAGDRLGSALAAGDLDGDGFDDLVLAATGGSGPGDLRSAAGEVVVVPGGPRALSSIDLASPPPGVRVIYGATADDALGTSVAVGDLDGDGFDDLILGASLGDGEDDAGVDRGEVAVLPGGPLHHYRHDPDAFAFIDATTGTDLGLACDDCGTTIPIGFTFDFYGRKHAQVTVSSNGYLAFGAGPASMPIGYCPPRSTPRTTWSRSSGTI